MTLPALLGTGGQFLREAMLPAGRKKLATEVALTALMSFCQGFLRPACKCVGTSLPPRKNTCAIVQRVWPTVAEKGKARAMRALAPLLEHGDFTVRSEVLVSIVKHLTRDTFD